MPGPAHPLRRHGGLRPQRCRGLDRRRPATGQSRRRLGVHGQEVFLFWTELNGCRASSASTARSSTPPAAASGAPAARSWCRSAPRRSARSGRCPGTTAPPSPGPRPSPSATSRSGPPVSTATATSSGRRRSTDLATSATGTSRLAAASSTVWLRPLRLVRRRLRHLRRAGPEPQCRRHPGRPGGLLRRLRVGRHLGLVE